MKKDSTFVSMLNGDHLGDAKMSVADPGFESRGGGGGRGFLRPQNLRSRSDHGEGLPSPSLAGSGGGGGVLAREILKNAMRRYAFFTILGLISEKSESEFAR